jgi:methanogenic corrinoid protein MtbC1
MDTSPAPGEYVTRILQAAEGFRVAEYDRLAEEAREKFPPLTLIREVFSPVLLEAGDRWEQGRFSVVQEHMLTSAVRRQLSYALDQHNRRAVGPALAFTTLSGERHEMGSLMLAVIAASHGFPTVYLGPDLPAAEVGRFCARVSVAAVGISIVTTPEVLDAPRQLEELRLALPPDVQIWLGGQATERLLPGQMPANAILVRDLAEFEERLMGLRPEGDRR